MIVTLLSDFGLDSSYVGQMKLALLEGCPGLELVEISHLCPPQDVRAAAFLIYSAIKDLPRRPRLHVCVVDPGVGSPRGVLALKALGQWFLAPDNGLLSYIVQLDPACEGWLLPAAPPGASRTFHGRDHFVPLALHLLAHDSVPTQSRVVQPKPVFSREPERTRAGFRARWLFTDGFGNRISALRREHLEGTDPRSCRFQCGQSSVGWVDVYSQAEPGGLCVLEGSSGHIELAIRDGAAAARVSPDSVLSCELP
ncbi:MAG: SAM-dependent chlorinase/fluorinase [Candidatus Delongbacteria bacterium]|nr:SAM-dependent chlorinase/fluorinase [Candidatus Cloacimonadota bacterium]MCB9473252.1 SAM-dependent chlorinase/fluorinase [Candidatus Delongbacteria bacterium]